MKELLTARLKTDAWKWLLCSLCRKFLFVYYVPKHLAQLVSTIILLLHNWWHWFLISRLNSGEKLVEDYKWLCLFVHHHIREREGRIQIVEDLFLSNYDEINLIFIHILHNSNKDNTLKKFTNFLLLFSKICQLCIHMTKTLYVAMNCYLHFSLIFYMNLQNHPGLRF